MSLLLANVTPPTFVPGEDAPLAIVAPSPQPQAPPQPWAYDQPDSVVSYLFEDAVIPTAALAVVQPATSASVDQTEFVAGYLFEDAVIQQAAAPLMPEPIVFSPEEMPPQQLASLDEPLPPSPGPALPDPWATVSFSSDEVPPQQAALDEVLQSSSSPLLAEPWAAWSYVTSEELPTIARDEGGFVPIASSATNTVVDRSYEQSGLIVVLGEADAPQLVSADARVVPFDPWSAEQDPPVFVGGDEDFSIPVAPEPSWTFVMAPYETSEHAGVLVDDLQPRPVAIAALPVAPIEPWASDRGEPVFVGGDEDPWFSSWSDSATIQAPPWANQPDETVVVLVDVTSTVPGPAQAAIVSAIEPWGLEMNASVFIGAEDIKWPLDAWRETKTHGSPHLDPNESLAEPKPQAQGWVPRVLTPIQRCVLYYRSRGFSFEDALRLCRGESILDLVDLPMVPEQSRVADISVVAPAPAVSGEMFRVSVARRVGDEEILEIVEVDIPTLSGSEPSASPSETARVVEKVVQRIVLEAETGGRTFSREEVVAIVARVRDGLLAELVRARAEAAKIVAKSRRDLLTFRLREPYTPKLSTPVTVSTKTVLGAVVLVTVTVAGVAVVLRVALS